MKNIFFPWNWGKKRKKRQEVFRGSPWKAKPTDEWNRPSYWHEYYQKLLTEAEDWRREMVIHRRIELLFRMLTESRELPLTLPQTLLDAGCGIALIPHILAYWGFQVTAIDPCPLAIEFSTQHRPSEEELAKCLPIREPCKDDPSAYTLVEDTVRSLQQLKSFKASGGSVSYINSDWFDTNLQPAMFGIIYCRNSLRCSTKKYWRRSLDRFYELLLPGGILLLENVNAIGIQYEMEDLLEECGFVQFVAELDRTPSNRYVFSMWPTG